MPIARLEEHLHKKSEYLIGEDVELHFCSEACLLREADHRSRIVHTGQTDATALTVIHDNNRLFVPIAGVQRPSEHVLGAQSNRHSARKNWEKLLNHKHPSLMPVYRVCDCMAEVQILDGEAFEDAGTTPAWKKVRDIVGKTQSSSSRSHLITFDQWRSWMGELAAGLHQLEQMGLAHGDPYPFNAISTDTRAIWVDFSHLTDDPVQQLKDAWAFVLFTLLHTLGKGKIYSPTMLRELAGVLAHAEQPGRFQSIQKVLSDPYSDIEAFNDARIPSLVFAEAVTEKSLKAFFNPNLGKLLLKAATRYFSDFLHHIHRGNQYLIGFHLERQRHQFVEQETLKRTLPVAEHQRQVASLNHAVAERDEQLASLNNVVVERDEQLAKLNKLVAERDGQILGLNQVLTERDGQLANINYLLAERDGQLASLNHVVVERDEQLAKLNKLVAERDGQILGLNQVLTERDEQLANINYALGERDGGRLASLNELVAERDGQLASLNDLVVERDKQLADLYQMLGEHEEQLDSLKDLTAQRDKQLSDLYQVLADRDGQLASLDLIVAERDGQLAALNHAVTERDGQLASLQQLIAAREAQLTQIHNEADSLFARLEQILSSRSWRYTRPLRATARIFKHGTPYADGHQYLYNFAARIGRILPFPMALKARVRKRLLERLYPSTAQPAHPEPQNQVARPILQGGEVLPASMSAERCGLVEGLVSVVLPVYNQADLIAESIDSVLNQTYQNFELIIINDGSTDGLEAVLDRYRDHPKIRCFQQENQRLPKALSNGFSLARGEFWTWTSADNLMEPRMLELLVKRLQADPALGMVYADYYAIDDRGALLQDPNWRWHNRPDIASGEIRLPRTTEALNVVQDNFIGPCFMYRGWIGRCLGDYDPQLGVEDYDYWMRINTLFSVAHLGDESLLYRYRVHDNTLSAKAHEHKILEKVQRLMIYERERAAFYSQPMTYATDSGGHAWLLGQGVAKTDISTWGSEKSAAALAVMTCSSAIGAVAQLLQSMQPVAVILNGSDTNYHKLHQLLNSGKCIVLAEDRISTERVRLLSPTCPVVDIRSGMVLAAIRAFTKNLQFFQSTRTAEELKREAPQQMLGLRRHHVVLQVDSFTQGGMENVVIDLALSLQSNEYQVSIVNFGKSGDAATKAIEQGLRVVSLSSDLPDEAYRSWLIVNNVNLVNAHYSIRGATVCANAGIPFIQTIHNSYVWLDPVLIEKYREADRYTTEYICVSMTAARYADVTLGLSVSKMRVVPNGIDPNAIDAVNFESNRASLRSAWGVSDETPVFLNVASIMATKAQLPLVKAFAQIVEKAPDARLVLLGAVMEEAYHTAIEKAIQELGLQKNVLLVGYDRHVSRYYHAADVFVLPSYWEGWSLSLGEAMANGLASVITDVGSAYEFAGFDGVEIIEPPFGDITLLNYRNLGSFVYGEDPNFQHTLGKAMSRMLALPRKSCNVLLASKLDRKHAYQKYMHAFRNYL